jgi:hypothetical protein
MKILVTWILVVNLVFLGSCSLFEDPQEQTQIEVTSEFQLELSQLLIPGPNPLMIKVSTINTPSCKESKIRILKSQDSKEITVGIIDIFNPINCEITNEVISESVNFLLNNGQFGFTLFLNASSTNQFQNAISNMGTINSSYDRFSLMLDTQNGFELGDMVIQKIPDKLLWGYLVAQNEEELSIFNDLINHISDQVDDNLGLDNGNYGYFSFQDGQISDITMENNPIYSKSFIYHSNNSAVELSAHFAEFKEQHPNVIIHVQHSEGLEF